MAAGIGAQVGLLVVVLLSLVGLVLFAVSGTGLFALLAGTDALPSVLRSLFRRRRIGRSRLIISLIWAVGMLVLAQWTVLAAVTSVQSGDMPYAAGPPLIAFGGALAWSYYLARRYAAH